MSRPCAGLEEPEEPHEEVMNITDTAITTTTTLWIAGVSVVMTRCVMLAESHQVAARIVKSWTWAMRVLLVAHGPTVLGLVRRGTARARRREVSARAVAPGTVLSRLQVGWGGPEIMRDVAMPWMGSPNFIQIGCLLLLAAGTVASPGAEPLRLHPDALPNVHAPGEVDRPELVPFIVPDPAMLPGVVVDETTAVLEGEWQYSTHTPPYVGEGYLHDRKEGKGRKSVTFVPRLPEDGWYEVRLAHCSNVRRAANTPVTIRHADGETRLRIDQQVAGEEGHLWKRLGRFRFSKGESGWVRISTEGTEGGYVIADAVQFLPVEPDDRREEANDGKAELKPSVFH